MSKNGALKLQDIEVTSESNSLEMDLLQRIALQLDSLGELKGFEEKLQVLWKLDKLDRLTYLAELQRLDKLGELENLQEMENLSQLDNLKYLTGLKELKNLTGLNKLDKLHHLMRLKSLNKLEELQALDNLKELDKLSRLKDLDKLSLLNKLDVLKKIEKLDVLHKVEDLRLLMQDHAEDFQKLDNLKYIEKLDSLKKLQALESLDNLRALDSLSELEKLKELTKLDKLSRLNELSNLERLEALSGLEKLHKLDELRHLEKLDKMQDLSKLDNLKDAKVQRALMGLDKLSYFQDNTKKFVLKIFTSIFLDLFKVVMIASLMFFVFTKNISRQTFDRMIPYLGFGEADRVNLALSILAKDLSSGDFDGHYKNLEKRVKREVSSVFDANSMKNLEHYRLLENLTSYNYHHETYDLSAYAKLELNTWATKTQTKFNDSYAYDIEHLAAKPEMEDEINHFRTASIFMKQQKYFESFVEMNQIKNKSAFASLGHGLNYAFYMAFRTKPVDLKLYLEK